jgi:hypothetical protein
LAAFLTKPGLAFLTDSNGFPLRMVSTLHLFFSFTLIIPDLSLSRQKEMARGKKGAALDTGRGNPSFSLLKIPEYAFKKLDKLLGLDIIC